MNKTKQNRNRLIDTENKLLFAGEEGEVGNRQIRERGL